MLDQESRVSEIPVRFEVRGKIVDVEKLPRLPRRLIEGQAEKYRRKYAEVVGPHGERPTIVIRKPDLVGIKVEIVLEFPETMRDSIPGSEKAVRID